MRQTATVIYLAIYVSINTYEFDSPVCFYAFYLIWNKTFVTY